MGVAEYRPMLQALHVPSSAFKYDPGSHAIEGVRDGTIEGGGVGSSVGMAVGLNVGSGVGSGVGAAVGLGVGDAVGVGDGSGVYFVGDSDGTDESVGMNVGLHV